MSFTLLSYVFANHSLGRLGIYSLLFVTTVAAWAYVGTEIDFSNTLDYAASSNPTMVVSANLIFS